MFAAARLVLILALLTFLGGTPALARSNDPPGEGLGQIGPAAELVPGEVLVRFRAGVAAAARERVLGARGVEVLDENNLPGLVRARVPEQAEEAVAAALERLPEVVYAEPNYIYRVSAVPNDPRYPELWGLPKIGAPAAWDVATGSGDVVVAVIDSGVAYGHPDIAPNLWTNDDPPGGGDQDGNGFPDDTHGWDFVQNDSTPLDFDGHGTHVAGTIGAQGNNGLGVVGVNWDVSIMPVRALDADGSGTTLGLAQAIDYACREGADVINGSFGGSNFSSTMATVITSAACQNTLHVYAAGNSGLDLEGNTNNAYPCEYHRPPAASGVGATNVICVAATNSSDALAGFSNRGATAVHLAAPGVDILSTWPAHQTIWGPDGFDDASDAAFDLRWGARTFTAGDALWARTTASKDSGTHSVTDSPAGPYADSTDTTILRLAPFSLAGQAGCRAFYDLRLDSEPGYDGLVVMTGAQAATTTIAGSASGSTGGAFIPFSTNLSMMDGLSTVYLRLRFVADPVFVAPNTHDGAYIDDLLVGCLDHAGQAEDTISGTSMAAPHVAGVAALLLGATSGVNGAGATSLSVAQLKAAILAGVDPVGALAGQVSTGGRLNARRALDFGTSDLTPPDLAVAAPSVLKLGRALKRGVKSQVTCDEDCGIVSQLVLAKKLAKKLKLPAVVGTTKTTLVAAATTAVTTKFTARAKRKLGKLKGFKVTLRTKATDQFGNATTRQRLVSVRR